MSAQTIPVPSNKPTFLASERADDTSLSSLQADIAVLGVPYTVPYDLESTRQYSSDAPAAIRAQSQRFAPFLSHYDYDFGGPVLGSHEVRIVDCGDVDMRPDQHEANARMTTDVVRAILERGAVPVVLGGDHAVPIPVFRAYEQHGPIYIVQIDAHIDWRDERNGVRDGLSSPMRRASEMPWVAGMAQIGIRGTGSARAQEFEDARAFGSVIVGARELHERGVAAALDQIPDGRRYYITFDADGLDPSLAPAVRSPAFGGVTYFQALDLLRGVARKGPIVGFDIVEAVPSIDVGNMTSLVAARMVLNVIGAMAHAGQFARS